MSTFIFENDTYEIVDGVLVYKSEFSSEVRLPLIDIQSIHYFVNRKAVHFLLKSKEGIDFDITLALTSSEEQRVTYFDFIKSICGVISDEVAITFGSNETRNRGIVYLLIFVLGGVFAWINIESVSVIQWIMLFVVLVVAFLKLRVKGEENMTLDEFKKALE